VEQKWRISLLDVAKELKFTLACVAEDREEEGVNIFTTITIRHHHHHYYYHYHQHHHHLEL
jgi:hypothetical protein